MQIDNTDVIIVRNCSHFTNVQTGILSSDGFFKLTIKKAFTSEGCSSLQDEYEGAKSFCEHLKVDPSTYIKKFTNNNLYSELHLEYKKGDIGNCHSGLPKNFINLLALIKFYQINMINDELNFSHGDLSVSNVIFLNDEVNWIIDWENYNEVLPIYYDLVYCLTELVLFSFVRNGKKVDRDTVGQYWDLFMKIENIFNLPNEIRNSPASWLRREVSEYVNSGNHSLQKCPFIQNNPEIIIELDRALCSF